MSTFDLEAVERIVAGLDVDDDYSDRHAACAVARAVLLVCASDLIVEVKRLRALDQHTRRLHDAVMQLVNAECEIFPHAETLGDVLKLRNDAIRQHLLTAVRCISDYLRENENP